MGVGRRGKGGGGGGVGIHYGEGERRSYAMTGLLGSGGMLFSRAGKEGGGGQVGKKKYWIVYAM